MEVDSVVIIAILSMSYITTRMVKTWTSAAKIPTRREFLREILYKNIAIIAIQHGKFILLTPLVIFPILLG